MNQTIEQKARYYFGPTYALTKQQAIKSLADLKKSQHDFETGKIPASRIIGKGYKPQYIKQLAAEWLAENIALQEYLIKNFDSKNQVTVNQENLEL